MSKRSRLTAILVIVGVLVAVAVTLAIAARPAAVASASGAYSVSAGLDDCGAGWGDGGTVPGGDEDLTVTNPTVAGMEVYLQEAVGGKVYLDLENLGAGVHAKAHVALGSGRYRFVCLPADADPVRGPTVTVGRAPASAQLTPGMVPVTRGDLIPVALAYGRWVGTRLPVLQQQVAALSADAEEGDLAAAKHDWLAAHTTYETLGAAYDAFGDVGDQIDGLPRDGLTGFHLVESQLWGGAAPATVAASTAQLAAEVGSLAGTFADAEIDPGAIALRAHEIVEVAVQDVLTGAADAGSGTELATIDANLEGAAQALAPLHDILAPRYADLDRTTQALQRTRTLVESFRAADGTWTPLAGLDRAHRERLDAALDQDAELLAPVAAICDPRRDS
ncbi:EfeM/EfeO family lipoprotein [Leifsonia sp. 71-9]|uniref:EfeM/EfeO family lipoprotein n=1 Tax=Leifsonia sp. 71-9 TaxID=1895934 RepID=UPI00092C401B|nr:EfeM/EfeO family lipoprotein [Leifsonia sp. 71-9]OJX80371.1 MAG: Efem/EfeO family lipoprotein [Leifsonia sp. 71-9]